MSLLAAVLRAPFEALVWLLLAPFRSLPPIVGLAVVSLATAVLVLAVFKRLSNQKALIAVKRSLAACLFEIRLFQRDAVAIVRAQGELLRHTARYLRLSLMPLLVLAIPLSLVGAQLQLQYGSRGYRPGERFIVSVRLETRARPGAERPTATLEASSGLTVETPAIWIPEMSELAWRVRADDWGDHEVIVKVDGETLSKAVDVSSQVGRRARERLPTGFFNQLYRPGEAPLPDASAVAEIAVKYPDRPVSLLGWRVHWTVAFFLLSTVFALVLRRRFGVTI